MTRGIGYEAQFRSSSIDLNITHPLSKPSYVVVSCMWYWITPGPKWYFSGNTYNNTLFYCTTFFFYLSPPCPPPPGRRPPPPGGDCHQMTVPPTPRGGDGHHTTVP